MHRFPIAAALSTALLGLTAASAASAAEPVRYELRFERTWSSDTHPSDFPLLAHFSPVIGVTHNDRYEPFAAGAKATPGLETLCETGKHQPLDAEIRAAIQEGDAGALIETADPLRAVPQTATASFEIDAAHPMVSIGAMIAPSPDWCALASDVVLYENGAWAAQKTVVLEAWDVGTDSATSYRALDADMQPRGAIEPSRSPYFVMQGKRMPVGTLTFVRQ
jgi:Spondin_N